MSDVNLWEAYDRYVASGFASDELEERLNGLLLGISHRLLLLGRNSRSGSQVIALRAQQIRQIDSITVVLPGDLVLVDRGRKLMVLVTSTTTLELSILRFSEIPLAENGKMLWLPILSLDVLLSAQRKGGLPHDAIERWIMRNRLL